VDDLVRRAAGYSVVVVDPEASAVPVERPPAAAVAAATGRPRPYGQREPEEPVAPAPPAKGPTPPALAELIDARAVLLLAEAIPSDEVIARLVAALVRIDPSLDGEGALRRLRAREREGSTLLDEGLALPHARMPGLPSPRLALAIAPGAQEGKVAVTVLLLAPEEEPAVCLALMSRIARLFRGPELRRALAEATDADQAAASWVREVERIEAPREGRP
jgi:PTS system nitrogen regulatory IIA component